ncbi:cupin domain-containing protein [Pedobacter nutrimenti]|jgi:mannose-6-phosphate isomerase-like protein (cupin superfamily)|uniref:Mannose-6-phosphate isomerase type 2 n=1 Tax=Pedobacter nutrimenti TaxID=1241337 RepID=A0A318UJW6_9SPHI|nr:phosphoheptose isomerase [Pedobacter nutrimenti]PYF74265.1 mannose-6-phosphate isomerase type 2 [Pedobacter nutrimenti]|eukprot:gene11135-12972_t
MSDQKKEIFNGVAQRLKIEGFNVINVDDTRPWGGFFVIDEDQAQQFANVYFDGLNVNDLKISGKLSPKILVVAPDKRLSWQYHHRRAEIWQVVSGTVGVSTSATDEQGPVQKLTPGTRIKLEKGERHRLIGLEDWGVVSEIWQHTDPENPSDESDIVRVQDDFGR